MFRYLLSLAACVTHVVSAGLLLHMAVWLVFSDWSPTATSASPEVVEAVRYGMAFLFLWAAWVLWKALLREASHG
jgi:hypothetical protein